jgi:hypothetical protein
MSKTILLLDDYMDNDVAYLLGMIMVRGTFHIERDVKRLIIHFPYHLMEVKGLPNSKLKFNQENEIRLSLDDVRRRINELLEVNVDIEKTGSEIVLKAIFTKNTMSWRNLMFLCNNKSSYNDFVIPKVMFEMPKDIQKEFVRGIADAAASPSYSDRDQAGLQRIVIQFQNSNWFLPIQVCKLLQENLNVNVQHILWGHPNVRTPNRKSGETWAKEHRLRIYAEDFKTIGFNFKYKQMIFKELVEYNQKIRKNATKPCNPKVKVPKSKKPKHPDEKSERLPSCLRGKHFDSWFQICQALGCLQGKPSSQTETADESYD